MVTARDLAQAQAYQRRRVLGAFTHGPGTSTTEQRRSGRVLVVGVALTVLLVGGGAGWASVTGRSAPVDWSEQGLVAAEETGQLYVVPGGGGAPWPAANVTSARLAVGDPSVRPVAVPDAVVREHHPGPERGIPAAPSLPADLAQPEPRPWRACASDGRLRVSLGADRLPREESPAFVVTTGPGRFHLLAPDGGQSPTARAYLLPAGTPAADGARDDFLTRLGLPASAQAEAVEPRFLALFPAGGDISLASLGVSAADPGGLLTDGDRTWLAADGRTVLMDDVAVAAHRALTGQVPRTGLPTTVLAPEPWASAHWPVRVRASPGASPCAVLRTGGPAPRVGLVGEAETGPDRAAGAGTVQVAGDGAWVQRWQGRAVGPPLVVDASGTAHPVPGEEDARALGLDGAEPVAVPTAWLALLERGPTLSRERATCPVRAAAPCGPEGPAPEQ